MDNTLYKTLDGYTFTKLINQPFHYNINSLYTLYITKYKRHKYSVVVVTYDLNEVYRNDNLTLDESFVDAVKYINEYMESIELKTFCINATYFYKGIEFKHYFSNNEITFIVTHPIRIKSFIKLNDSCKIKGYSLQTFNTSYTIAFSADNVKSIKDCLNHYNDVIKVLDNYK